MKKTYMKIDEAILKIASHIQTLSKASVLATPSDLSHSMQVEQGRLSPSSASMLRKALDYMLSESMIAKKTTATNRGGRSFYYVLLQPLEDIEARLSHPKKARASAKKNQHNISSRFNSKVRHATIDMGNGITIKLTLE